MSWAVSGVNIHWSDFLVMGGWMMFGRVICQIGAARAPLEVKFFGLHAVLDPVVPHMHCSGAFLSGCAMENVVGSAVVCF